MSRNLVLSDSAGGFWFTELSVGKTRGFFRFRRAGFQPAASCRCRVSLVKEKSSGTSELWRNVRGASQNESRETLTGDTEMVILRAGSNRAEVLMGASLGAESLAASRWIKCSRMFLLLRPCRSATKQY